MELYGHIHNVVVLILLVVAAVRGRGATRITLIVASVLQAGLVILTNLPRDLTSDLDTSFHFATWICVLVAILVGRPGRRLKPNRPLQSMQPSGNRGSSEAT